MELGAYATVHPSEIFAILKIFFHFRDYSRLLLCDAPSLPQIHAHGPLLFYEPVVNAIELVLTMIYRFY